MEYLGDCIEWTKYREHGYGRRWYKGTMWLAHRAAWDEVFGPIPPGMCICHLCDNRACVNIDHLFISTQAVNIADTVWKGRNSGAAGEKNGGAKLSAELVIEIRSQRDMSMLELARKYGVSRNQIWRILRWKSWTSLNQEPAVQ